MILKNKKILMVATILNLALSCGTKDDASSDDDIIVNPSEEIASGTTNGDGQKPEVKPEVKPALHPVDKPSPTPEVKPPAAIVAPPLKLSECGMKLKEETFKQLELEEKATIEDIIEKMNGVILKKLPLCGPRVGENLLETATTPPSIEIFFEKNIEIINGNDKKLTYLLKYKSDKAPVMLPNYLVEEIERIKFFFESDDLQVKYLVENQNDKVSKISFTTVIKNSNADEEVRVDKAIDKDIEAISFYTGLSRINFSSAYLPKKTFLDWLLDTQITLSSRKSIMPIINSCFSGVDNIFDEFNLNKCKDIKALKLKNGYFLVGKN